MSSNSSDTGVSLGEFETLWRANLIPLHACLVGLAWVIYDYFLTVEDEIRFIWPQKRGFGKFMFLWIRYYTILLLMFDVTQIHVFSIPGITSDNVCVAMDSIIRVVGAISLWSVEIIMQLRVYALFKCSKRIAIINGILFMGSIAGFLFILVHNAIRRRAVIADAIRLPLPGCPSIHSGIEWAQWVPATAYEGVLFGFALYKTLKSTAGRFRSGGRISLYALLLRDNLFYFFGIACLLIFNNLMVVGLTHIPWFSYGPFHAAVGIATARMLLNLRKASLTELSGPDSKWNYSSSGPTASSKSGSNKQVRSALVWRAPPPPNVSFGSSAGGAYDLEMYNAGAQAHFGHHSQKPEVDPQEIVVHPPILLGESESNSVLNISPHSQIFVESSLA